MDPETHWFVEETVLPRPILRVHVSFRVCSSRAAGPQGPMLHRTRAMFPITGRFRPLALRVSKRRTILPLC